MKNIDVIQQHVDEIKIDLDKLKKESNTLKSEQEKISAEEKKQKELLLSQKKEAIEIKKKEVEKMLIDIKLEQLDQAQLQKVIDTETEIKNISLELNTLKEKNWLSRQIDAVTSKEEWKNNKGANAVRAIGGIGAIALGIWGVRKLFGLGKKNNDKEGNPDKEGNKKEKKPRYKRRWGMAGIGAGGILAWKNRDTIKGWFAGIFGGEKPKEGDGKTDTIEDSGKEFKEKLSEEEKSRYNNFADQVNAFYISGAGEFNNELQKEMLGSASFEMLGNEKIQGIVPFMLNNRYTKDGGIDKLLSETTFYKEAGLTDNEDGIFQKLKSWSADQLASFLGPIASSIDGMLPAFLKFKASKKTGDLLEWIKGSPEARAAIRLAFRKSLMIISYINSKENSLKHKIAKEVLSKQDSSFDKKNTEEQNEIIADKLQDEKFSTDYINAPIKAFRASSLYEGIKILEEKKCLDNTIDPITQEAVDDVEKRKNKLLDKNEEGDKIEEIKSQFESGKLSSEGKKNIEELLVDFEEEIDDVGSKSWYNKYIPLMNFFDPSDQIMEKILKSGDYDTTIKIYREKIIAIREKLNAGTLTTGDLDDLKKTIDDYYVFQKSLAIGQTNVEEVVDKNGNKKYRWWNTIIVSGETLWHGGEIVAEGKYLEGGALVAGSLVSLDILTYPIRLVAVGVSRQKLASSPSLKAVYKLGKFTIKKGAQLTGKSLNIAMRNYMPSRIAAAMYKDKDYIFRLELAKGNIPLEKAVKIAKRNGIRARISGNVIDTQDELLQRVIGIGNSESDIKNVGLIKKYWNNKNVMKQVIDAEYKGKWYKIIERAGKYNYRINPETIKQLGAIDDFLGRCTHAGKASLVNGFLETTKTLKPELIQELFATKTFDLLSVEESTRIGKLLGKKINTFASLDDFKAFQGFFARNYAKYPSNAFVRNTLSKRGKLKNMDEVAQTKYIETAGLNVSRYEKLANNVKKGVNTMIKDLNGMLKNPKMKTFHSGIESKINNLTEYVKTVSPESIKATQEASWLDKITGFSKLSDEGITAMKSLNLLIKTDKALLTLLSKANTLDEVKGILKQSGIAVEHIDDGVLLKIVQTKNIDKIKSIINYGSEFKAINTLKKIFTNPSMKVFAKWLGIVGAIVDFAFVGVDFVSDMKEAEAIKQHNSARGENKESEAYFDVIIGGTGAVAGLIGAVALFGAANGWNPVGRVCLAGVGTAVGVEALGDLYYGEIDKFKQNYKDFLSQSMPEVKQRLLYINSWQNKLEPSFQDFWSKATGNMGAEEKKNLSPKTSADAVKALIYLEELQKYPYASADLNATDVRNNPKLKALVEEQKNLHDKSVSIRYEYIKKNYIDGKSSIVSKDIIEKNKGIQSLDDMLAESRMCQAVEADTNYTNKTDVKGYQNYLESDLKKSNADGFAKLDKMYAINKIQFFHMIASLPYYENILQGTDIAEKEKIVANLEFFKKFANYKLANLAISEYPTISVDKDKVDYDAITNLLSSRNLVATTLTAAELGTKNIEYLTDAQVVEKYNVSSNLGQNILYDIANKKLGYVGKNDLAELKVFYSEKDKAVKGIYFDPGDQDWAINENNGSDNEFATDTQLNTKENIIKMRGYIYDAANSSTTGNMIAGNDTANKEYAKYFVDIINQNLDYKINPTVYYLEIAKHIKENSNGKYIQLPHDLLMIGIKAGIPGVGAFVYRRDGKVIEAKSGIPGIKSVFVPVK